MKEHTIWCNVSFEHKFMNDHGNKTSEMNEIERKKIAYGNTTYRKCVSIRTLFKFEDFFLLFVSVYCYVVVIFNTFVYIL